MSGHQHRWVDWLIRISKPKRSAALALVGLCAISWTVPALAYRPFDGTDAAVADLGEVEIEFQPAGAFRAGSTKPLSEAIFNYGFADRWELVLQGTAQVLPEAAGPLSVSNGAFLKYVLLPGVLQEKQREIQTARNTELIGDAFEILVSGKSRRENQWSGYTTSHRMINFASQERELLGTYVQVRVTGAGPNNLVGEHAV